MNELNTDFKSPRKRSAFKRNTLTVSAVAAALAGGYALGGTNVTAQNVDPNASTRTPVVQTPATNDAATMQRAFNDVSKAIEPAVVTITTQGERPSTTGGGRMRPFPGTPGGPGGADPFGGRDPFEEFLRRFPGFGQGQGENQNWTPNKAQKEQMRAYFREVQQERGGRGGGLGSGMIYRADGYIITNAHVVRGANKVSVKLNDGRVFPNATVVGSDQRTDIAVIKINATKLPVVQIGDSGKVNVGDWAIAVGNPFGFTHTVTVGVISAKARDVPFETAGAGDYLQTDASINPGNSGGPLCDIYGRVIGVNNAIYSASGGNVGIGFAIPINTARNIADRLRENGKIVRAYLGVSISSIENAEDAQRIGAGIGLDPNVRGVFVGGIGDENGPGAKAGLQAGDVITEFNGQKVTRSVDLQRLVGDSPVGSNATLRVLRGDQTVTLTARLGQLPDENARPATEAKPEDNAEGAASPSVYGMRLSPVSPGLTERFNLKGARGVVVTQVEPGSPAADAGVQPGDVIERVGQTPVTSRADVLSASKRILDRQGADEQKTLGIFINRGGQRSFYFLQPTN